MPGIKEKDLFQSMCSASCRIGVYYADPADQERADRLGCSLGLPVVSERGDCDLALTFSADRLVLSQPGSRRQGEVTVEFVRGSAGYRRTHAGRETLLKAVGFHPERPLFVLDATGGMGKDSFLLASHGCRVDIFERNRVVAALLQDGLRRAAAHPATGEIAGRIRLSIGDSLHLLQSLTGRDKNWDVIYLDPMFPQRNKSALVKKEMRMLQQLIGPEEDTEQLFSAALAAAGRRVVVKRPKTAPPLPGRLPSHSLAGKTTRFDVYLVR